MEVSFHSLYSSNQSIHVFDQQFFQLQQQITIYLNDLPVIYQHQFQQKQIIIKLIHQNKTYAKRLLEAIKTIKNSLKKQGLKQSRQTIQENIKTGQGSANKNNLKINIQNRSDVKKTPSKNKKIRSIPSSSKQNIFENYNEQLSNKNNRIQQLQRTILQSNLKKQQQQKTLQEKISELKDMLKVYGKILSSLYKRINEQQIRNSKVLKAKNIDIAFTVDLNYQKSFEEIITFTNYYMMNKNQSLLNISSNIQTKFKEFFQFKTNINKNQQFIKKLQNLNNQLIQQNKRLSKQKQITIQAQQKGLEKISQYVLQVKQNGQFVKMFKNLFSAVFTFNYKKFKQNLYKFFHKCKVNIPQSNISYLNTQSLTTQQKYNEYCKQQQLWIQNTSMNFFKQWEKHIEIQKKLIKIQTEIIEYKQQIKVQDQNLREKNELQLMENMKWSQKYEKLNHEIQQYENKLQKSSIEYNNLNQQNKQICILNNQYQNQIQKLKIQQKEFFLKLDDYSNLQKKSFQLHKKINQRQRQLSDSKLQYQNLYQQIQQIKKQNKNLNQQISLEEQKFMEQKKQSKAYQEIWNKQLENFKQREIQLMGQYTSKQKQKQHYKQLYLSLKNQITEVSQIPDKIIKLAQMVKSLQMRLSDEKKINETLKNKIQNMNKEIDLKKKLKQENQQLLKQRQLIIQKVRKLQNEKNSTKNMYKESQKAVQFLKQSIYKMQNKIQSAQFLNAQLNQFKEKVIYVHQDIHNLNQIQKFQFMQEQYKKEIKQLTNDLIIKQEYVSNNKLQEQKIV